MTHPDATLVTVVLKTVGLFRGLGFDPVVELDERDPLRYKLTYCHPTAPRKLTVYYMRDVLRRTSLAELCRLVPREVTTLWLERFEHVDVDPATVSWTHTRRVNPHLPSRADNVETVHHARTKEARS